jgi:hypothetical protein
MAGHSDRIGSSQWGAAPAHPQANRKAADFTLR